MLAYVHVPESDPPRAQELLYQVLAGMRAALDPHGISLVGGHTTHGMELLVGLAIPPARLLGSLGPIAWAVLECLAASCVERAGETVGFDRGRRRSLGREQSKRRVVSTG